MMAQTTRTHARIAVLGFVDIAPHLGGQILSNHAQKSADGSDL